MARREEPARGPGGRRARHRRQQPCAVLGHGREGDGVVSRDHLRPVLRHEQQVPGDQHRPGGGGQAHRIPPRGRVHGRERLGQAEREEGQRRQHARVREPAGPPRPQERVGRGHERERDQRPHRVASPSTGADHEPGDADGEGGRPEEQAVARGEQGRQDRRPGGNHRG